MVRAPQKPAADRWAPDPDFGDRLVRVTEYDRPRSGADEALTAQSIAWMHRLANADTRSAPIRHAAVSIIDRLSYGRSRKEIADAIFDFVQRTVRYRHEDAMRTPFADFGRFLYDQTLIAPAALLQMPQPEGDCVDFSMLTAALCRLFALPAAYKTIAAAPDSNAYSHVYVIVQLAPGRFYALDTSNAPAPGWEFDLSKGKKSRLWPNPADLRKPAMITRNPRRPVRLGDGEGDYIDSIDAASSADLPLNLSTDSVMPDVSFSPATDISLPAASSSASSGSFTSIATTIINDAAKLVAPIVKQQTTQAPYYIAGKNGAQVLYSPSTGTIQNASSSAVSALTSSPNSALYLGLGLVLILAMSAKK